jgi:hypothetical protein
MIRTTSYPKYDNFDRTTASWLTTNRPDYYLSRTHSLFNVKRRVSVQEGWKDISTQDNTKTILEYPSQLAYPTVYNPPPTDVSQEQAYRTPRSGNQPVVVGTHNPNSGGFIPYQLVPDNLAVFKGPGKEREIRQLAQYNEAVKQRQLMAAGLLPTSFDTIPNDMGTTLHLRSPSTSLKDE